MTKGLSANPGTSNVRKRRLRVFLMYILPPLIALFVVAVPLLSTVTVMPRIRVSPGFALIDQHGEILTNEDLRGNIVLFGLVSLSCADGCLTTLTAMQQAVSSIPAHDQMDNAPGIRLVAIVVDAGNDPETLLGFSKQQGLSPEEWSIISGSAPSVEALVASGFEVDIGASSDGRVVHETALFLTDQAGFLRAEYRNNQPRPDTIERDIYRVLDEAAAGRVGGLLYSAAHSLSLSCGG